MPLITPIGYNAVANNQVARKQAFFVEAVYLVTG